MMRNYVVVGPVRGEVVPILDDGTGPLEYGCAYVEVDAPDRSAAIRAARKDRAVDRLIDEAQGDGKHPYTYLRVLLNPTHCEYEAAECDEDICATCGRQLARIEGAIKHLTEKFG